MNRDELFEILYGKDKVDIYRKYQEIEAQVEDSDEYYKYAGQ